MAKKPKMDAPRPVQSAGEAGAYHWVMLRGVVREGGLILRPGARIKVSARMLERIRDHVASIEPAI